MSDSNQLVARNVRRYRQERGLSLAELARRSGLSKQTLSKVEQGVGNPTVETLTLLGSALEIPARRLLTEWGSPVFVQRRAEDVWSTDAGLSERVLDEVYGSGHVRNHILRLERGATTSGPRVAEPPGSLHHVYVIDGRLKAGPLTDPVVLEAGDFVRFPGDVPYTYESLSEVVTAHVVSTLPQLRQFGPSIGG
ncbi:helix-turn-helix domain-containing protein [Rhodococcus rhodnii]|uniref:DNA-binding protein n=2 Tax=Rhodococcus rhodnii TaxID=38312 RepID=R7WTE1_9NOCA|nr:XRE family transcriptional regulator [Rhodococcus rhodnii]EOM78542.1 DNA-binding protein [Rhodococcus rhodnii LMG 5362]TXG91330.1 helix-turn-helix domain-containing protein [Rhodococcus rhodnii]